MKKSIVITIFIFLALSCLSISAKDEAANLQSLNSVLDQTWSDRQLPTGETINEAAIAELKATYQEGKVDAASIDSMVEVMTAWEEWYFLKEDLDIEVLERIYSDENLLKKVRGYAALLLHFAKGADAYAFSAFEYAPNTFSLLDAVYKEEAVRFLQGFLNRLDEKRLDSSVLKQSLASGQPIYEYADDQLAPEDEEGIFFIGMMFDEVYPHAQKWAPDVASSLVDHFWLFESMGNSPSLSDFLETHGERLDTRDLVSLIHQYTYFTEDRNLRDILSILGDVVEK